MNEPLKNECFIKAQYLIDHNYPLGDMSHDDLTDLLYKLETEKIEKNKISDKNIEYNDEIVEIEELGKLETIDISVSGDNLFYCNNILTKNSFGLPATADFMFAIISTEKMEELNQIMVKQLKNRYNDPTTNKKFIVGIDRSKMKLFDVDESEQNLIDSGKEDDTPVFDVSTGGKFKKRDFSGFDYE